jgi:PHD/YefM family antitoxin component YafN of YafNO toxin-antitoxin module
MYTISARQLQREYKKVLKRANKISKPFVVISNNQPQGAIIGLDLLEKLQLEAAAQEALNELKEGKTRSITNEEELNIYLKEINTEIDK